MRELARVATTEQEVVRGDCRELILRLRNCCVDAVVTDPPFEIGMMSHAWDRTGVAFDVDIWRQVLRVLKPGGHLAVHAAGRVYHRVACAIEDAGFEPRELVPWIFGTGQFLGRTLAPGVGTRLRTAAEPIGIFRKPFDGSADESYAKWGVGGLQIERSRLPFASMKDEAEAKKKNQHEDFGSGARNNVRVYGAHNAPRKNWNAPGRLPTNLLIGQDVADELGDRARYFYCVKASRAERDAGLGRFKEIDGGEATKRRAGSAGLKNARAGAGRTGGGRNPHSTVKPLDLVRWLCRLVAPPGGIVLDLFAGSGTTPAACALEGLSCLAFERDESYARIARARVKHWRGVAEGVVPRE